MFFTPYEYLKEHCEIILYQNTLYHFLSKFEPKKNKRNFKMLERRHALLSSVLKYLDPKKDLENY